MSKIVDHAINDLRGYLSEYPFLPSACTSGSADRDLISSMKLKNTEAIKNNDVVVFAKVGCGFCAKAKKCLEEEQARVPFTMQIVNVKGDSSISSSDSSAMQKGLNQSLGLFDLTFPQIMIRGRYVGGADDLLRMKEDGKLEGALKATEVHAGEDGKYIWDEELR